jgi:hypothetical protein
MTIAGTVIKDIPEVSEAILYASSRGKLVVFVGAGASRIIGCPSWKKFSIRYLKYLCDQHCINYYEYENLKILDPKKLLSICEQFSVEKNVKRPELQSFLSGIQELIEKYKIYEHLYSFRAICVTTNYDDYLDREAEKRSANISAPSPTPNEAAQLNSPKTNSNVLYYDQDILVSNLMPGNILHLHGSIKDATSIVMTTPDYLKHYAPGNRAAVLLEEIFNSYTVLFIGYGLEEYELLEYLVSKARPTKNEINHYILYPVFKTEANLIKFHEIYYKNLGIKLIPYPIDDYGHEHLAAVTEKWAKQIGPISRPSNFYDRARLIDEVVQ